ncbi:MAG: TPM domain-containing protein, partial [Gemmatimonadales bacterium]
GLEGIVTDAAAGRVRDLMRPELAAGRYGPGLLLGVQALSGLIARGFGVSDSVLTAFDVPTAPAPGGSSGGSRFPFILFLFLFILLMSLRPGRRRRRVYWGGPWVGGGWGSGGGWGGGGGGGGFGGFGGGGGFSGGGAGGRF